MLVMEEGSNQAGDSVPHIPWSGHVVDISLDNPLSMNLYHPGGKRSSHKGSSDSNLNFELLLIHEKIFAYTVVSVLK